MPKPNGSARMALGGNVINAELKVGRMNSTNFVRFLDKNF